MEKVEITSGVRKLAGNVFRPENSSKLLSAVLFLHGWQSVQDRYFSQAEQLAKQGFICLTFDFSGHGSSQGNMDELSRQNFLEDAIAAYDFLVNLPQADKNSLSLVGSSFGGYIAVLLSAKRNCIKIILRAPADYPNEGFSRPKFTTHKDAELTNWRSQPHEYKETFALIALHEFGGKVLIIEAEKDEIIPKQTLTNYKMAVSEPSKLSYVVMENSPHSISKYPDLKIQFVTIIKNWLLE